MKITKLPKALFKSGWIVIGIGQAALALLAYTNLLPEVQRNLLRLEWYELFTPALWLAFWGALWFLGWLGRAVWFSFKAAQRSGGVAVDKRLLEEARLNLAKAEKQEGAGSKEAAKFRRIIRETEQRIKAKQAAKSGKS